MTERVDFYVLKNASAKQGWVFACRLAEKAYLRDLRVAVLAANEGDARGLDDLLWTFSDRSFVPHTLTPSEAGTTPVWLTSDVERSPPADLLVNLSNRMPGDLARFARIAEIIDADEERKRLGRERFKSYRELQLTLETHQLDPASEP
jgi:DNA polymerase-3 subunit chi